MSRTAAVGTDSHTHTICTSFRVTACQVEIPILTSVTKQTSRVVLEKINQNESLSYQEMYKHRLL